MDHALLHRLRSGDGSSAAGLVALLSLIVIVAGCLVSPPRARGLEGLASSAPLDEPARIDTLAASPPAPLLRPPRSIEELRERVAKLLEREGVPGVGLALVDREGVIWVGGVGVAERETGRPVDADTVFRVASISKSLVALGVVRLVEQDRLKLDAPLRELMPEIEIDNAWAERDPITLAHALEHTAGFDDMRFNEWWGPEGTRPREALAINPRSRVARWRPGSRMSYSNPGYTIAGHAIDLASGEPWERWLEREILRPIGMTRARFHRTPALRERLATGYVGPEQPAPFKPLAHAPAGSLLASPRELASLVHFWLRRGQLGGPSIVSPAGLDRIERSETATHPATDASYGLGNYGDVMHPVRARGHDGGLPGFLSTYRYFPELGVGYVMLLNGSFSVRAYLEIRALLFATLARGRELPSPPIVPPDDEAIAADAGYYAFANPRIELTGFIERALLGLELRPIPGGAEIELLTGGTVGLVPTGEGGYRHPREGGTSVRVGRDSRNGRRVLVIGMAYFEDGSKIWGRARLVALRGAMVAMQLSLLWALGWLVIAGVRRLRGHAPRPGALALRTWPALASASFVGMLALAQLVAQREAWWSRLAPRRPSSAACGGPCTARRPAGPGWSRTRPRSPASA